MKLNDIKTTTKELLFVQIETNFLNDEKNLNYLRIQGFFFKNIIIENDLIFLLKSM